MWKILIIASTRPNHASFPHTYKIFNQQTMSHYISVVNTHQYTGAYHATFTPAAQFFPSSNFFHYHFRKVFTETKQCLLLNFPWHWYTYSSSFGGKKWKINAAVHMLKLIICREAKIYLKKKKIDIFFENVITLKEYEKTL